MKVWKRVLVKALVLIAIIVVAGGAGVYFRESGQATSEYALNQYARHLIDNEAERAYEYLDKSGDTVLTQAEFAQAVEAKKYALYADYHLETLESRVDETGNEFQDYRISFVNSDDETQAEEIVTVKKQAEKKLGFFDEWLVEPGHCMVQNFTLTVPAGATVTLDGQQLWEEQLSSESSGDGVDQYVIPEILPGSVRVQVSHPVFDDVVTDVDTTEQTVDLCASMQLSDDGEAALLELGIRTLRELYAGAVSDDEEELSDLFTLCQEEAESLRQAEAQGLSSMLENGSRFVSLAVGNYSPEYGAPVFDGEAEGIQAELRLTYRHLARFSTTVSVETGEYDEEGYAIMEETEQEDNQSGDTTARLTFSYYEGTWHLTALEVPGVFYTQSAQNQEESQNQE